MCFALIMKVLPTKWSKLLSTEVGAGRVSTKGDSAEQLASPDLPSPEGSQGSGPWTPPPALFTYAHQASALRVTAEVAERQQCVCLLLPAEWKSVLSHKNQ